MNDLVHSMFRWVFDNADVVVSATTTADIYSAMATALSGELCAAVPALQQAVTTLDALGADNPASDASVQKLAGALTSAATLLGDKIGLSTSLTAILEVASDLNHSALQRIQSEHLDFPRISLLDTLIDEGTRGEIAVLSQSLVVVQRAVEPLGSAMITGVFDSPALAPIRQMVSTAEADVTEYLNDHDMSEVATLISTVGPQLVRAATAGGDDGREALAAAIVTAASTYPPIGIIFAGFMALGNAFPNMGNFNVPTPSCEEVARRRWTGFVQRFEGSGMTKPADFDRCFNEDLFRDIFQGNGFIPSECLKYYDCSKY